MKKENHPGQDRLVQLRSLLRIWSIPEQLIVKKGSLVSCVPLVKNVLLEKMFCSVVWFGVCCIEEKLFLAGTCKSSWVFIILVNLEKFFCERR